MAHSNLTLVSFGLLLAGCVGVVSDIDDEEQSDRDGVSADTDDGPVSGDPQGDSEGDSTNPGDSEEPTDDGDGYVYSPPEPCPLDDSSLWVWENVERRPEFHEPSNMQTVALAVDPIEGSVYAAASNETSGGYGPDVSGGSTGIWKSMDCGATWELKSTGTHSDTIATGQLWAMRIDPVHPQNIYVANGYGAGPTLYKSSDGGVNWKPLKPDPDDVIHNRNQFVQAVALDPDDPRHIAVTFHESCERGGYNGNCLSRSRDGGETWQIFNGPPEYTGWHEAATLSIFGPTHYLYGNDHGVHYTADEGEHWEKVINSGLFGRYAGSTTIAPDGTAYLAHSGAGVFWSKANPTASPPEPLGAKWTLIPGSPNPANIISDGVNLISAQVNGPPFHTAKLSDRAVWTFLESPGVWAGSNDMAYDPVHRVIYSANFEVGLLRMKTDGLGVAVEP